MINFEENKEKEEDHLTKTIQKSRRDLRKSRKKSKKDFEQQRKLLIEKYTEEYN